MGYAYKDNKNLWHEISSKINFIIICRLEGLKLLSLEDSYLSIELLEMKELNEKLEKKFHVTRYIFAWMIVVTWSLLVVHGYILSHRRRDILCTFPFEKSTL